MVKFDELRISEDGNYLTVECHVEGYDVYSEMYIKSIYLEYYKNRGTVGVPSDKAILLFENTRSDPKTVRGVRKRISLDSLPGDFGTNVFERGLFYVYVTCDGDLRPEAMTMYCGYDVTLDVAVIPDWKALYKLIMPFVAKLADGCSPCEASSDFEHMILLWNALRFAIDTCDWVRVDRIWNELMGVENNGHKSSSCGCWG